MLLRLRSRPTNLGLRLLKNIGEILVSQSLHLAPYAGSATVTASMRPYSFFSQLVIKETFVHLQWSRLVNTASFP